MKKLLPLSMTAVVFMAAAMAHADRNWALLDQTTVSTAMSTPTSGRAAVSCGEGVAGVSAKCSQASTWQRIGVLGLTLACGDSDGAVHIADTTDKEDYQTVDWANCGENAQNVYVTGELTVCDDVTLSVSTACQ